jgi:predicted flavoprotein YhiN
MEHDRTAAPDIDDVLVVGAGAAGLMAAIAAAEAGARVTLLNAHQKPGLKILMSGGTRCNVTHARVEPRDFHGASPNAVGIVLKAFGAGDTRRWFEARGVALKEEPGGKLFPVTDSAKTVLAALLAEAERLGVRFEFGVRVTALRPPSDSGDPFTLDTSAGVRRARTVVLASGGLSFPKTGSDGSGYALAKAAGHSVTPTTPALTPLLLGGDLPARLAGLTLPAALTLFRDGRRVVTCAGSLLVTHTGLSGPAALDLSRHWLRAGPPEALHVSAHFLPGPARPLEEGGGLVDPAAAERPGGLPDRARVEADWLAAQTSDPRTTVRSWLARALPDRLVRELLAVAGLEAARPLGAVTREERRRLLALTLEHPIPVIGSAGYGKAEVTAGGVPLDELDPRRMASRRCPGLFLAGEIVDVDGRLGGFNFQWAWSSGRVAGRAAAATATARRPVPG